MEQNDGAVVGVFEEKIFCIRRIGLLVVIPVRVSEAPKNRQIAEILRVSEVASVESALGRTVKSRHFKPCLFFVDRFQRMELAFQISIGKLGHILVMCGMIADEMPLLCHAYDEVGVAHDEVFENEERACGIVLFQCIEDACHVAVFIAGVEGEVDDLFLRIFAEENAAAFRNIRHLTFRCGTDMILLPLAIPVAGGIVSRPHRKSERKKRSKTKSGDLFYFHVWMISFHLGFLSLILFAGNAFFTRRKICISCKSIALFAKMRYNFIDISLFLHENEGQTENAGAIYHFLFERNHKKMAKINIVLVEPEIPQNTGNIARTCSATGAALHLVKPMGFELDDKKMKRAGLDYWDTLEVYMYENLAQFMEKHGEENLWFFTTKATRLYTDAETDDVTDEIYLVFGKETKGLPEELTSAHFDRSVRIPMLTDKRSLNLSNSVAIAVYEILRKESFAGLKTDGERLAMLAGEKNG